ncbi:TetR/AcrR family transcriptional regulator [Corynebacterium caspium]|uniref:TetR/AcrR family transcriptional regulator n=1 Tax=Corynebacterium caspium TaxID=234828 RepID=UPI0003712D21|nr:TetR family transcriptional regulator [Corynebacterium caspium]WKD59465.1 DNA-binding transcriptional repressor AcrR [Corynebacterium caspium DSM 44850]
MTADSYHLENPAPPQRGNRRRFDPSRKQRIIDAAVKIIVEQGSQFVTHRAVAQVADVPLGSMTYHFQNLADLLDQAWLKIAIRARLSFYNHFANLENPTPEDFRACFVKALYHAQNERELYAEALVNFAAISAYDNRTREHYLAYEGAQLNTLGQYVDETTSLALLTYYRGIVNQAAVKGHKARLEDFELMVQRLTPLHSFVDHS